MERFRREAKELGIAAVVNIYERASPGEYYDTSVVMDTDGRLLLRAREARWEDGMRRTGFMSLRSSVG